MTVSEKVQLDLDAFVATEYPRVVAAVGLITGNRQDAADAVQDAIVGFLARPPAQPVANLAAWFTVVASNRVRDGYRTAGARQRAASRLSAPPEDVVDPLRMLDHDVLRALKSLPLQQRQVVALHYLMDQSVDTIAEGLGVSAGSVKTQFHRARTTLAARVRVEGHRG